MYKFTKAVIINKDEIKFQELRIEQLENENERLEWADNDKKNFTASTHQIYTNKKEIYDLATCHFIEKKENIWFLGQSGVGKTHLAHALSNEACRREIDTTFTTVDKMLGDINGGRKSNNFI